MSTIKKKNKYAPIISAVVMLIASGAVIAGTHFASEAAYSSYDSSQPIPFTIASTEAVDVAAYPAADYGVISAEVCKDASGAVVAYTVETSEIGFNAESPIILKSTIAADGTLLVGIKVVDQDESKYYGEQIKESWYQDKFDGRLFPILSGTDSGKGSHIDGISGATVTSDAVLRSINNAYNFVMEQLG